MVQFNEKPFTPRSSPLELSKQALDATNLWCQMPEKK
jgi:hypothetical protein